LPAIKTAVWLYLFLFVAFFDLHAQYPILSPFAVSLGAAPAFIGWMMGVYSFSHIPGNWLAGPAVDRFGGKPFIALSLALAGLILMAQAWIENPWQLLVARSCSGFVLAFLSPACQAILARLGDTSEKQGRLMAGNGLVHTLASVTSPALGALLVAALGFRSTFFLLGALLLLTGLLAARLLPAGLAATSRLRNTGAHRPGITDKPPRVALHWFAVPAALAFSQGILYFELPLMGGRSLVHSGLYFSMLSLGAACTLAMLFLHRYSAAARILAGGLGLALLFYERATVGVLPFALALLLIGMAKGLVFPAIATQLAGFAGEANYGKIFARLSVSYSLGALFGPLAAGYLRPYVSPYFAAFVALFAAVLWLYAGTQHLPVANHCQAAGNQR
jgi:MFS family permease